MKKKTKKPTPTFNLKEARKGLDKCLTSYPADSEKTITWMISLIQAVIDEREKSLALGLEGWILVPKNRVVQPTLKQRRNVIK